MLLQAHPWFGPQCARYWPDGSLCVHCGKPMNNEFDLYVAEPSDDPETRLLAHAFCAAQNGYQIELPS